MHSRTQSTNPSLLAENRHINTNALITMIALNIAPEQQVSIPVRVLHLEDSALDHELVRRALNKSGESWNLMRVETLEAFELAVRMNEFDVILADYRLSGFTALDAWYLIQALACRPPFILISGAIGEPAAVAAIKSGISDYLAKDDLSKLAQMIHRAIEVHGIRKAKEKADLDLSRSEKRLSDFADHLQATIEQERASIAREIHDDIGGSLTAVKFDLAWMRRHTSDTATLTHLQSATDMLQHALEASQRIMMNLRPAILDQGLIAAVQWLAADFIKRTGIRTTVRASCENDSMPKAIQLAAYRTTQEALTNISKYADCTDALIDLSDAEGVLTVEIRDNGKGFHLSKLTQPKSFGIRGLHERAKTVGGWLDVSTQLNQGTAIILSVPLQRSH